MDENIASDIEEEHLLMDVESSNIDLETDDEGASIEEIIQVVEEAWLNEKFAPEILPHKKDFVDIILGQITYVESQLEQLKSSDFQKGIHQMEIDRLRFLVTSYLRLRLEKIETYCSHILQQEKNRKQKNEDLYLDTNELAFALEYEKDLKQHFESVMSFCPGAMPNPLPVVAPNLHSMVFLKSKKDVEGVMIHDGDNGDLIDLANGSQVLISYNSVARLVKNRDVHLI